MINKSMLIGLLMISCHFLNQGNATADTLHISLSDVTCNGLCNGTATVDSVTGGTPPYKYLWSNGDTAATAGSLCTGIYTITVIDSLNDTIVDSIAITEPAPLNASIDSVTDATCQTPCNGSAAIGASGGVLPYTYQWSSGESGETANALCGTFSVMVSDSNGCSVTETDSVQQPPRLNVTINTTQNISCNSVCDGALGSTVSGGQGSYTYNWSTGASTASISSLCAGTYTLTTTDADGCSNDTAHVLNQPAVLNISITGKTDNSCAALCEGEAFTNTTGGTTPYAYQWDDPASQNADSAISLCAGNFQITVTDSNGCTDQSAVFISEPLAFGQLTQIPKDVLVCDTTPQGISFYNNACDTLYNTTIAVQLPPDVHYIQGSVTGSSITVKDSIITDPNAPVFTVPVMPDSGWISITYSVQGDCGAIIADTVHSIVSVNHNPLFNDVTDVSDGYITRSPVISISQTNISPVSYRGNVEDSICRTIKVKNTGNATLFTGFTLDERYRSSVELLSASPAIFANDTAINRAIITVPDSLLPSYGLMPDSIYRITECLTITECTETADGSDLGESVINYFWECENTVCQQDSVTANALVPVDHRSGLTVGGGFIDKDVCYGPGNSSAAQITFSNKGKGPAFNVSFTLTSSQLMGMAPASVVLRNDSGQIIPDTLTVHGAGNCSDSVVSLVAWHFRKVPPGEQYTIDLNTISCCPDTSAMPTGYNFSNGATFFKNLGYIINYREQCDEDTVLQTALTGSVLFDESRAKVEFWGGPTDMDDSAFTTPYDGDTGIFKFRNVRMQRWSEDATSLLRATYLFNGGLCYLDSFNLDSSLVIYDEDSNKYWMPENISIDIDPVTCGGTVTAWFRFGNEDSNFRFIGSEHRIRLIAQCDAPPSSTIDLLLHHIPTTDPSCTSGCAIPLDSAQGITFVHCPGCVRDGIDRLSATMLRKNYGLPDNNNDGIADVNGTLDQSKILTSTVMTGDTIMGIVSGAVKKLQFPQPHPDGFQYGYYELKIPGKCDLNLTPVAATVRIKDASTTDVYTIPDLPMIKIGGHYFVDYSIDKILAYLPPSYDRFDFEDSITIMPMLRVTGNPGAQTFLCTPVAHLMYLGIAPDPCCDGVKSCKPDTLLAGIVLSNGDTLPQGGGVILTSGDTVPQCDSTVRYFCEGSGSQFFMMGYGFRKTLAVGKSNCSHSVSASTTMEIGVQPGTNRFPYEYRNWGFADTVSLTIPPGFAVDSMSAASTRTGGFSESDNVTQFIHDIEPDSIFTNANGDTALVFKAGRYYSADSAAAFDNDSMFYFSDDDNSFSVSAFFHPTCETEDTTVFLPGHIGYEPGFTPQSGIFTSSGNVSFEYVAPDFSIQPQLITVDGVTRTACWQMRIGNNSRGNAFNTWMTAVSPSGNIQLESISPSLDQKGDVFLLGDLRAFNAKDVEVCASYNCNEPPGKDTLIILLGWNCPDYPDALADYPCKPDSFVFILQPRTTGIQTDVQIKDTINICDTLPVSILVSSSDVANLYDITIKQSIPTGMSFLAGSGQLEYPPGTPVAGSPTPFFDADTLVWKIDSLNSFLLSNGLPGSGLIDNPDSTDMLLTYRLKSGCEALPDRETEVRITGVSNCKDTLRARPLFKRKIHIIDYPTPVEKTVDIEVEDFAFCDSTATVKVSVFNNDTAATDSFDLFNFILPACVSYHNGFTDILNGPENPTHAVSGNTLTWQLRNGVAPGDTMRFSFEIRLSDTLCGLSYQGNTSVADSLFCSASFGYCQLAIPAGKDTDMNVLLLPLSNSFTSVKHVSCFGLADGSAKASVSNGETPYTYLWSNGNASNTANNLLTGSYLVAVTDNDGCTLIDTVTITEPDTLVAVILNSTEALCADSCNGTATVLATGGIPPYQYLWNSNETDMTAIQLCAGIDNVVVTDSVGCMAKASVIINEPDVLSATITNPINASCAGQCNASATVTPTGGTPPYTYSWTGSDTDTGSVAVSLCAGNNIVTVTDTNGCTAQDSVFLTEPSAMQAATPEVNDLTVCTESPYNIKFSNTGCDTMFNVEVTAVMPDGIIYSAGSVSGNVDTIYDLNIDEPNSPVFFIPAIPPGTLVDIDYTAFIACGMISLVQSGALIIDTTKIAYTGNIAHSQTFINTESHNVIYANPVILNMENDAYAGAVGDVFERTVTVINGGNAPATSFRLIDEHGDGILILSVDTGTLSGNPLGDTITVDNIFLAPGSSMDITETIQLLNTCDSIDKTTFTLASCKKGDCDNDTYFASAAIYPGKPDVRSFAPSITDSFNECGNNGRIKFQYHNNGGDGWEAFPGAGAAWDLNIWFDVSSGALALDSFTINGTPVPDSIVAYDSVAGTYRLEIFRLRLDLDSAGNGFSDINGDSIYTEFKRGDTIVIEMNTRLNCFSGNMAIATFFSYRNQCGVLQDIDFNKMENTVWLWSRMDFISICPPVGAEALPTINYNDTIPLRLCLGVDSKLECPSDTSYVLLELPQGYELVSHVLFHGDTITVDTLNVGKFILRGGDETGCYDLEVALTTCRTAPPVEVTDTVKYTLVYECAPGCCTKLLQGKPQLLRSNYQGCIFASSCLQTTDLSVKRTTLGWTDNTKIYKVTDTTAGIRTDEAFVFDSIEIVATGVVKGSSFFNNAHVQITYTLPDSINILTYAGAVAVIIRGVDTTFCIPPVPTPVATGQGPIAWTLDFDLTGCLPFLGISQNDTIILTATFLVDKPDYFADHFHERGYHLSVFSARHYGVNLSGDTLGCETAARNFYFVNQPHQFKSSHTTPGCDTVKTALRWKADDTEIVCEGRIFPDEFRNRVGMDSVLTVFVPKGYTYIDSSGSFSVFEGDALTGLSPFRVDTTAATGDTLFFNEQWPFTEREFFLRLTFTPPDTANCSDFPLMLYIWNYNRYDYADNPHKVKTLLRLTDKVPGAFDIVNTGNVPVSLPHAVSLTENEFSFDLFQCNTSEASQSVRIALRNDSDRVNFKYVTDNTDTLNTDTILPELDADGITRHFVIDIPPHSCKKLTVAAAYNASSCEKDSIAVFVPGVCQTPGIELCLADSLYFYIFPDKAKMQTRITPIATAGVDDCTPSAWQLEIINSQFRSISDIDVTVDVPAGFSIDTALIQYPSDTAFRLMPPADLITGNIYGWKIDSVVPLIATAGLTGVTGFTKSRLNLRVFFKVDTGFDFTSNAPLIRFGIYGDPLCNNPAVFNHQRDGSIEVSVNAAFDHTPFHVLEGDTVRFMSVDATGTHTWLILDQSDSTNIDTLFNNPNPIVLFDSAGLFTITHIVTKLCASGLSSDTVVLRNFEVEFQISEPGPVDGCFSCSSKGASLTTDPHFAVDYDCASGSPMNFSTNLTWACRPVDYNSGGLGSFTITDDAAFWIQGGNGLDHTPGGGTNFFLGSITNESADGIWMEQAITAGFSYNISIWVKNVMNDPCTESCLPSFQLYVYNHSFAVVDTLNKLEYADGWVRLCGEYKCTVSDIVNIGIRAINGTFTPDGVVFESGTINIGFDDFEVFEQETVQTLITATDTAVCPGDSVGISARFAGSKTGSILWSTGDTTENITVSPAVTTTYTAGITDVNGCSATDSVTIFVSQSTIEVDGSTVLCRLPGNTYQPVTLTASEGVAYLWSTGATTRSITVSQAGTYSLSVTHFNGCVSDTAVVITEGSGVPPQAKAGNDATISCGNSVQLGKPGPTVNHTFDWMPATGLDNPALRRPTASPVQNTIYALTVFSDISGCAAKDSVTITVTNPCCNAPCKTSQTSNPQTPETEEEEVIMPGEAAATAVHAYPNPFSNNINIELTVAKVDAGEAKIKITDMFGRVAYEKNTDYLSAGKHVYYWNGARAAAGVYNCKVLIGAIEKNTRLVLIR